MLYEHDHLLLRTGASVRERRNALDARSEVVAERDDLTIARVNLLVQYGELDRADDIMRTRTVQPWEGREGDVLSAWDALKVAQFHASLVVGDGAAARHRLREAIDYLESLGEGSHPLSNRAPLYWLLGLSESALGNDDLAISAWAIAAASVTDFTGMSTQRFSDQTHRSVRALDALGRNEDAEALMRQLGEYAVDLMTTPGDVDFFAPSLPSLLTFHNDPKATRHALGHVILQQLQSIRGIEAPPFVS